MYKIFGSYVQLYSTLNILSFLVVLIFNLTHLKYQKLNPSNISKFFQNYFSKSKIKYMNIKKTLSNNMFWSVIEIILISCIQYLPSIFLNFSFGKLVGTGANYFGLILFVPYILFLFCYLLKINPLYQIDSITPSFPLALTVSKLACFCAGCCRGVECSFGLYNYKSNCIEFPVQLLEAIIAFIIFIFLMFWRKKAKSGTMFPTYLIIYSFTRFFSEFLRVEPNIFWGLKKYHFLCIIGIIFGIVELIIINKFRNKIQNR